MPKKKTRFATELIQRRKEAGYTTNGLSVASRVPVSKLFSLEKDMCDPMQMWFSSAVLISRALAWDLDDMLGAMLDE